MARRSFIFGLLALLLALVAGAALLVQVLLSPTALKVAVGGVSSDDAKVMGSLALVLQRERSPFRLRLLTTDSPRAAGEAMQADRTDLAVVRTDVLMPTNAATVAIMRRDAALFVVPPGGVRAIGQLRGRTIALAPGRVANRAVLEAVLTLYSVPLESVTLRLLEVPELQAAARAGEIDAYFSVGQVPDVLTRAVLPALGGANGESAAVLPIVEAAALVALNPAFEVIEIPRGTFGGTPPRPAEPVPTLAVSHRLVASRELSDALVADLTRHLFAARPTAARDAPLANRMETPETEDKGAAVPVHPGTIAYLEGEEKSFFERYGDWLYFTVMGVSLLGSALAAFFSRWQGGGAPPRNEGAAEIAKLLGLLQQSRRAESVATLDSLESDADVILNRIVQRAADGELEDTMLTTFTLALSELRHAIAARRRVLESEEENGDSTASVTSASRAGP